MDLWIDELYVGSLLDKRDIASALATWQQEHEAQVLYLIELDGCQYPYADYAQGIWDSYSGDQKIILRSATKDELQLQLVTSVQEYIKELSQSLENLSAMFYARPDKRAWNSLSDFLEQLELLQQSLLKIGGQYLDNARFSTMLEELLHAMEIQDSVSVGDILAFRWLLWLQELDNQLTVCSA
jgi:hypothetical protein